MNYNHIFNYFSLIPELIKKINKDEINNVVKYLSAVKKKKGRIFYCGFTSKISSFFVGHWTGVSLNSKHWSDLSLYWRSSMFSGEGYT